MSNQPSKRSKPTEWHEFAYLERHDSELRTLMRIRAIELFFTSDNATAIRAGEFLTTLDADASNDLSGVDIESLRAARARALKFIEDSTTTRSEVRND